MEEDNISGENSDNPQQLITTSHADFTKTELEREPYYMHCKWDGASLFDDWMKDNWYLISVEVFDLLKLYRILDQIMFLMGLDPKTRRLYTKQALQFSAAVIISIFTIQLQAKPLIETLEHYYETAISMQKSSLDWDGKDIFNELLGETWHEAEDGALSTLKLCRLLDRVMFAAGISIPNRKCLINSKKITTAREVRELMKLQLLTLELQTVKLKLLLKKQLESNEESNEKVGVSECIIQ